MKKLKVNLVKIKMLVCGKRQRGKRLNLSLKGKSLEEVNAFKYSIWKQLWAKMERLRGMC